MAAYELDGKVPQAFVQQKAEGCADSLAGALVAAGLWEVNGRGWLIHDWLKYNPSRAQAKRLAKAKQAAGKRGGEARAGA